MMGATAVVHWWLPQAKPKQGLQAAQQASKGQQQPLGLRRFLMQVDTATIPPSHRTAISSFELKKKKHLYSLLHCCIGDQANVGQTSLGSNYRQMLFLAVFWWGLQILRWDSWRRKCFDKKKLKLGAEDLFQWLTARYWTGGQIALAEIKTCFRDLIRANNFHRGRSASNILLLWSHSWWWVVYKPPPVCFQFGLVF